MYKSHTVAVTAHQHFGWSNTLRQGKTPHVITRCKAESSRHHHPPSSTIGPLARGTPLPFVIHL